MPTCLLVALIVNLAKCRVVLFCALTIGKDVEVVNKAYSMDS
jgi:hypothetical protein